MSSFLTIFPELLNDQRYNYYENDRVSLIVKMHAHKKTNHKVIMPCNIGCFIVQWWRKKKYTHTETHRVLERAEAHAEHLWGILFLNLCENCFNLDWCFFAHQLSSPYTYTNHWRKKKPKETTFCLVDVIRWYSLPCIYTFSVVLIFANDFNLVCRCKQTQFIFICLVLICISVVRIH